ncbi:MAG: hypothetical protein WBG54_01930 [Acidobacteriaceae bacterium]
MDEEITLPTLSSRIETSLAAIPWTRSVAAGSLAAGAVLLLTGRRRSGLILAAAGAAVALLENPESVRDAWNSLPRYIRSGQDFIARAEDFVQELNRQGHRIRNVVAGE